MDQCLQKQEGHVLWERNVVRMKLLGDFSASVKDLDCLIDRDVSHTEENVERIKADKQAHIHMA